MAAPREASSDLEKVLKLAGGILAQRWLDVVRLSEALHQRGALSGHEVAALAGG